MKRLIALSLLAASLAVVPLGLAARESGKTTTIKVSASEFKFVLSKKSAHHGTIVFTVVNKGHTRHDFKIAGKKTPMLSPGKKATLRVKLKTGRYKYLCTVPGHAAAGMKGTFKAT
jgi:uncharacterized cupredoxin-like copper-binding protein